MALDTITREEFDKRLDAANSRRSEELKAIEEQQMKAEQLLSYYECSLDAVEAELNNTDESEPPSIRLHRRLKELADRTAQIAAMV